MSTIADIRKQYPQYADLSDADLAKGLHAKFYSDMPFAEFAGKVGLQTGATGSWGRGATGGWQDPKVAAMSALERFRAGAGTVFRNYGLGVNQMRGKSTEADVDRQRVADASLLEDPVARAGELTANIAVPAALAFLPGGQSIAGSALIGGAIGAAQPVGTGESRVDNTIKSAAISGGVTAGIKGVGRVLRPVKNVLNDAERKAVDLLKGAGVRLSVGQQTGSKAVQATERMLGNNPYTGPAMGRAGDAAKRSLTRAFLRTVGENADSATPEVLARAKARIGGEIGRINSSYALDINNQATLQALADQADEAARVLPDGGRQVITQIDRIMSKASANGGKLDGRTAQAIKGELDKLAQQPNVSPYAQELREILDDALQEATKGTKDFAALKAARSQYRNLMSIADAADTTANGQISATALAQRLKSGKYTKGSFRYGAGDARLAELARAASTVADRFPNSGTAAHVGAQLAIPTAVGAYNFLESGDIKSAAGTAAATWAAPKAAAFALNNPKVANYLAQGVGSPVAANALEQYLRRLAGPAAASMVVAP